ncbi:hypothetical protein H0H87_005376 [Tephrocybe sp. NHM501043]|nr:hypothetical protein H0H87_005376 [Tephrocybe sp. NHM501043]
MGRSRWSSSRTLLLLSSVFSGVVGFTLATIWESTSPPTRNAHKPQFGTPDDFDKAIQELKGTFPDEDVVSTDPEDLRIHGFSVYDHRPGRLHSVVFYPNSTEDVVRMVKIATKYKMPVIPYSGATSLEGQVRSVSYLATSPITERTAEAILSACCRRYLCRSIVHGPNTGNTRYAQMAAV